jgi:hypothetical protein
MWRVEYTKRFLKELASLPKDVQQRAEMIGRRAAGLEGDLPRLPARNRAGSGPPIGQRGVVDQLHQPPFGIAAVQAAGPVAMGARRGVDDDAVGYEMPVPDVHGLGILHQEPDMIEVLPTGRGGDASGAVQGQVIGPRGQIHVVRIGPPLDPHAEDIDVESLTGLEVMYVQGQMAEAQGCRGALCGHPASITNQIYELRRESPHE